MKQAQTDADELIAAYRLEQQEAFDKAASVDGKKMHPRNLLLLFSLCISHSPLTIHYHSHNRWIRQ